MKLMRVKVNGAWVDLPAMAGANGVSPAVSVEKAGKVTTITITDANGPHTATICDGADGQGSGDMIKATYDADGDGVVDDATRLGGKSSSEYAPATHAHAQADISGLSAALDGKAAANHAHSQYLTAETDPTVPAWAKAASKPAYSAAEVGAAAAGHAHARADVTGLEDALAGKVDKASGKGLSANDYTSAEKDKLAGIEAGANAYAHPASHPASMITGLSAVATSGSYADLANTPDIPPKVTVDTAIAENGENPVTGGAIHTALAGKADAGKIKVYENLAATGLSSTSCTTAELLAKMPRHTMISFNPNAERVTVTDLPAGYGVLTLWGWEDTGSGDVLSAEFRDERGAVWAYQYNPYVTPVIDEWRKLALAEDLSSKADALLPMTTLSAETTLTLAHAGRLLMCNLSSAMTVTVPTNASVAFPVGTQMTLTQMGAGKVTIAPASGVTINSKDSKRAIAGQYGAVTLVKTATNVWYLWGALTA